MRRATAVGLATISAIGLATLAAMAPFSFHPLPNRETDARAEPESSKTYVAPTVPVSSDLLVIDAAQRSHRMMGFGVHMEPGDIRFAEFLQAMNFKFVRMECGPTWAELPERIPSGASRQEMDAFVRANFDGDWPTRMAGAKAAFERLRELGIAVILVGFQLPWHWLADDFWRTLKPEHHADYVRFFSSLVAVLAAEGARPAFVEICNEPDGNWNGHIPPADFSRILAAIRREFDARGLGDVGILGPGLAFLAREHVGEKWVDALSPDAVAALAGWSTHAWDEVDFRRSRPEFLHNRWRPFREAIARKDPAREKPVLVTEFSTEVTHYNGREWPSPREGGEGTATESVPFAVRVFANSLVNINNGCNGLIYWRLCDHHWHRTTWGLLGPESAGRKWRPVATCLATLLPIVPPGAWAISPTWFIDDDTVNMAAWTWDREHGEFAADVAPQALAIALANHSPTTQRRTLEIRGFDWLAMWKATAFVDGRAVEIAPDLVSTREVFLRVAVEMPAESTLTLAFTGATSANWPANRAAMAGQRDW